MKLSIAVLLGLPLIASLALAEAQVPPSPQGVPDDLSDEVKARGIIGIDDRRSSRNLPPRLEKAKRRVGELITYQQSGNGMVGRTTCTASLIDTSYVITAAHCAFDSEGRLLENTFFYPDIDEGRVNYNKYRVARVFLPASYRHDPDEDMGRDIAIMELEPSDAGKTAGDVSGWFGYWGMKTFPSGNVTTLGYPGDKEHGHQYFEEDCLAENGNPYNPDDLQLDCDIYRGQSGSPVLVYSQEYEGYYVHGVIQSETGMINFGSRISPERQKIFRLIVRGKFGSEEYRQSGFVEQWRQVDFVKPRKIFVYARNNCTRDDLYIAYYYKGLDEEWRTEGFAKVAPKHEVEIFNTGNGVYYLSARNPDGNIMTRSDITRYMSAYNRDVGLQRYNVLEYGTFTYSFDCH